MYTPKSFECSDNKRIHQFIKDYSFGTLITQSSNKPYVTHLPFLLDEKNNRLLGHMAKANPHWKAFSDNPKALCIFNGPHSYISPTWYEDPANNVPTWDYVAIHVNGKVTIIDDTNTLDLLLRQTTETYEKEHGTNWDYDSVTDYKDKLMGAVVGFSIEIDSIESTVKMSQNRNPKDRAGVPKGLREQDSDNARAIADLIEEFGPK